MKKVYDTWKDNNEFKKVVDTCISDGCYSSAVMFNIWIEKMVEQYNRGCREWDCEELECLKEVKSKVFYVVVACHLREGYLEQLSNGLSTHAKAVEFRDSSFTKERHPNAYVLCSVDE